MRKAMPFARNSLELPDAADALPGRPDTIPTAKVHFVNGRALAGPYPTGFEQAMFALGCYWAGERRFWSLPGVHVTAAGNTGGISPNPTYEEVCSGATGHAETVLVVYDPKKISYEELLKVFWESHDPTQNMRQGTEIGTQYRSAIYWTTPAQRDAAVASKASYEKALRAQGYGPITTEITEAGRFYFAEADHQQYLAKDPNGPGGLGGTGVSCPIGTGVAA
jgi:peptide-methionine (S)-S-oxide reductase